MTTVPPHKLFVYQKPRQGTAYLDQYSVANYKHKLSWHGPYDTASCNLQVSAAEAERIFRDFIGNVVAFYVDNPMEPIFEGYISAIIYETGGIVFRRSLEEMSNRVHVTYFNADSPAVAKTETTPSVDNATSQAIYGIKTSNLDAGVHFVNLDKTHLTGLRDTIKSVLSYPQVSVSSRAGGGVLISLEIKGLYHMWDWELYYDASTAVAATASRVFQRTSVEQGICPANASSIYLTGPVVALGPPSIFMQNNAAWSISIGSLTGQTYLQFLQSIVEAGDGTNEWVFGITPRQNDGNRYVYYRPAATTVKYTCKALRDTGVIFDLYGRRVDPWRVTPDAGIRITDVLVGYDQAGDNPSESYIKFIEYDAESQSVSWQSSDDATLEGSMDLRKYFKRLGRRFGAPVRQLV